MDKIEIDGTIYYTSTHAAKGCEYTRDYISRLAREGMIDGRKIGNAWFISRESLHEYISAGE